jgi:hypothetical protein
MTQLAIYAGHWIGGSMVIFGTWLMAQSALDNVERYVGGSLVIVVGSLIIRWVLKTSERVEALWSGALLAANERATKSEERADRCEERCIKYQHEIDMAEAKYDQERLLRISLEEKGIADRRHTTEDRE